VKSVAMNYVPTAVGVKLVELANAKTANANNP